MSAAPAFAVNGRFLAQPVTGVQRYARNVIGELDRLLAEQHASAPLIAPSDAADPGLAAMPLRRAKPLSGHAWEQATLPASWPGRLLNLCNTAPIAKGNQVVCIHDTNVFTAPQSYSAGFRALYRTLQPALARRASRIATVSSYSAREIGRRFGIPSAGIAVLPNGHEHALKWDPARARTAPDLATKWSDKFVLALGSRARHKNLGLLIDIAPQLAADGVDLVIAGGGGDIFASEALAAAPNVHTTGYLSDNDLAWLLGRALCLAFPSWTEGFGLPIVEAMARGCPVVSSNRASMPEVCGDAALLAAPDDPAAWVRHVRELAASQELRRDLAGRGHERLRLFSWADTAAGYLDLMRQPAAAKPRPAGEACAPEPRIAAVIATIRRPEIVSATARHLLETQTLKPASLIISCVSGQDAGEAALIPGVTVITGPAGLAAQRNTALSHLPADTEIVAFFDDDFVADRDWLLAAARIFRDRPEVVGFTGAVIADDIKGPGLSFAEAVRIVDDGAAVSDLRWTEPYSPYGCNMAFRASAIGDLRFDERLVLYGWLEDRDFGAALAKRGGRLIKSAEARGVHMGWKGGRVAGDRLGYSQVINPVYLLRKGTMTLGQVADHVFRNLASNFALSLRPEPFIDRRGRARGNIRAIIDLMRGRVEPERAVAIQPPTKG